MTLFWYMPHPSCKSVRVVSDCCWWPQWPESCQSVFAARRPIAIADRLTDVGFRLLLQLLCWFVSLDLHTRFMCLFKPGVKFTWSLAVPLFCCGLSFIQHRRSQQQLSKPGSLREGVLFLCQTWKFEFGAGISFLLGLRFCCFFFTLD